VGIRIYGALEVTIGAAVRRVPGAKERAVLAYLATRPGEVVRSDRLVDDLWEDSDADQALRSLRVRISNLRSLLVGSGVTIDGVPGGYWLNAPAEAIDLTCYHEMVRSAATLESRDRLDLLGAAAQIRRAAPLPEFHYADFAEAAIRADEEVSTAATLMRAEALVDLGRPDEAVVDLRRTLESDPTNEAVVREMMRALAASGRMVEALDEYGRLAAALAERGLEPSDETRRAEESVLIGGSVTPPASTLPALPAMIGRDDELADLVALVRARRFVTVLGAAGIGKTTLAVAAARSIGTSARTEFVDLSVFESAAAAAPAMAGATGAAFTGETWRAPELLDQSPGVIVLDNCEHMLPQIGPMIERLVAVLPATRVIATSRIPLGVPTEQRFVLGPLRLPEEGAPPHEALASPAVGLFLRRAAAIGVTPVETDETVEAIAELCRALDGIPLAIELAAMKTTVMSPQQILMRIDERLGFLADGAGGRPPHQRSLEAALAWSVDLLSGEAKDLFGSLSVFRGSFDLAAVEAVATAVAEAVAAAPAASIVSALAELADHSLLVTQPGDPPRYRLLETVRVAAARLLDHESSRALVEAYSAHFQGVAARVHAATPGEQMFAVLQNVDADGANLSNAIESVMLERPEVAAAILADGWRWWHVRGRWAEGQVVADRLAAHAMPADRVARLHFLDRITRLKLFADREGLEELLDDKDALAGSIGQRADNAVRALLLRENGALDEAAALHRAMVDDEIARGVSARATLANLAVILILQRNMAEARAAVEGAIEQARLHGEATLDTSMVTLAEIELADGNASEASAIATAWLGAATSEGGDAGFAAMARHIIGQSALRLGDLHGAREQIAELLRINVKLGDEYFGFTLCLAAAYAVAIGEIASATRLAAGARRLTAERSLRPYLADLLAEVDAAATAAGLDPAGPGGPGLDIRALLRLGFSVVA
jgi:predicted ATPase/DNA-binding SARP family transcriptional activator